ncbi:hypothetical protein FHS15_000082 [Paenibacillus castaneae]|uniref:hypothetical protein n=1 Tax=Paenibacillus castaneae TaxID=474957 RepID=UPI000C9B915E|nr:hypothetical protein [Paenibacillus castaneae]NIK74984.1 hypothetical protein [Paenibacillus castaneae]
MVNDEKVPLAREFINRLHKIDDPAAIVVTIHLFCENALNQLMKQKKKTPDKYITEQSAFLVKLDLCYNMGLLNEPMFNNLVKLNTLRNKCAHKVDVDFDKIDHNYWMGNVEDKIGSNEKSFKDNLVLIGVVTYGILHNHLAGIGIKL